MRPDNKNLSSTEQSNKDDPPPTKQRHKDGADPLRQDDEDEDHQSSGVLPKIEYPALLRHDTAKRFLDKFERAEILTRRIFQRIFKAALNLAPSQGLGVWKSSIFS